MRIWVLDTNVVVSGLMSPSGTSARVLNAVLAGRLQVGFDSRILSEYRDVLNRPRLKLIPEKISDFIKSLESQVTVTPKALKLVGPDNDDLILVEAALATVDKTIVTENLARFPKSILCGVRAISPAEAAVELADFP